MRHHSEDQRSVKRSDLKFTRSAKDFEIEQGWTAFVDPADYDWLKLNEVTGVSTIIMRSASSVTEMREPNEGDRQTVRKFFYSKPLMERANSLLAEMQWVLAGRGKEEQHSKTLPDYCYNIFDALRITFFKNFPALTDIVFIKNQAGLSEAKTIDDAKKVIQIDWKNLGRSVGVGLRCLRFAEMEAENGVDGGFRPPARKGAIGPDHYLWPTVGK